MASKDESRSVSIFINGEQAENSLKGIEAFARQARGELRKLIVDSEDYNEKLKTVGEANAILATQKDKLAQLAKTFGETGDSVAGLNKRLQIEQDLLSKAKIGSEQYINALKSVSQTQGALEKNRADLERIRLESKATGDSMEALDAKVKLLTLDLGKMAPGADGFKEKLKELKVQSGKLQDVQDDIKGVGGAFGWLKQEIGSVGMIAGGFLGFQFITSQFQNVISQNAALSDSITAIQKTTGMSEQAVRRLQGEFGKMDTRTPKAELNGLAEVAGKLGISGERDVMGFVRAANQIGVALGNTLGNTEEAINNLGKLTELFKIKDTYGLETALLKTGSAITELGNAGTADEGYLVEFTKRLGGIAPAANFSIQSVLGLATTMDELGQPLEASATAVGQFVVGMGKDIPKFAKIAGLSVQDFASLLKNDGNQALISVLKNVKSTGQGVAGLAENMGMVGEDGARAISALGALSNNLDILQQRQLLANQSFEKGSALTEAYNNKNENFAATVEKLGKRFSALTTNTTLTDFFTKMIIVATDTVNWLNRNMEAIGNLVKAVIVGSVAFGTYKLAVAAATLTQRNWLAAVIESEAFTKLAILAETAWTVVKLTLTGRIREARAAMIGFNAVMEASPWGIVLGALAAAASAYVLYTSKVTYAAKAQETMNDIKADTAKRLVDEKTKIEALQKALSSETLSREQKLTIVQKLREITKDTLKGLSDEEVLTNKGTVAINKYINALERKVSAEAAQERIKELVKANIDLDTKKLSNDDISLSDDFGAFFSAGNHDQYIKNKQAKAKANRDALKVENDALIKEIKAEYGKDMVANLLGDSDNSDKKNGPISTAPSKTLESLKAKLTDLQKQLETAELGSKEFYALKAKIKLQQTEIDKYEPKSGASGTKKAASEQKQLLKEFEGLSKEYQSLGVSRLNDQLATNEREVAQEENKYNILIAKDKTFLEKKKLTATERKDIEQQVGNLEIQKGEAVKNIRIRQETELLAKIKQLRAGFNGILATEYQKQLDQINKFYDEQKANAASNAEQLTIIELNRKQDLAQAEIDQKKRLEDEKQKIEAEGNALSGNKDKDRLAIINKKYDDEIAALKAKFSVELQATQEFQDAVDAINHNRKNDVKKSEAEQKKEEKDKEIDKAQSSSNAVFSVLSKARKAETNAKISELEKQKNAELDHANLTEKQKAEINSKYTKLENQEKLRAWKADQRAAEAQAVINTALAVTKALPNLILAGIAAAAGFAEIETISTEQAPQYATGGYSAVDYSKPQGFVNRPTMFAGSAARPFIAGEGNKTEYIVSSEQLRDPVIANFVAAMEANRGVRRFENGGYSAADLKPKSYTSSSSMPLQKNGNDEIVQELRLLRGQIKNQKVILSRRLQEQENSKVVQIRNDANA